MTTALAMASVLQWIVTIVLGIVVFALARQIGVLHQRVGPAGALMVNKSIRVGQESPSFSLPSLGGGTVQIGGARDDRISTLLMFVSPDCPVCKQLLPAIRSISVHESRWLRLVLASDGDPVRQRTFAESNGLLAYPFVLSTELGLAFQIGKLPYAILIDERGVVVAQGLVNSREHIESLFEAKRMGVASIQQYLTQAAEDADSANHPAYLRTGVHS